LRYESILGNTDYKDVCELLQKCGYATSHTYAEKLIKLIEQYELTQYDREVGTVVKIAIDAGHGYNTSGKRCLKTIDSNQTREWTLNSRIAAKLQELLKSYECEVLRTDDSTGAVDVGLNERCNKANEWGADIFISIHHNAGLNGRSGGGTQVYYHNNSSTQAQAKALYDAIVERTGLVGNRSSKVIKKAFTVIANTKMAAYLIENGFMDSPQDTPVILTDEHATKTAQGILNFLIDELGLERKPETETIYRVQCGAFSVRANAEALRDKLIKSGFEAVIISGSK
jgi:N-acetylmuramoyl-L-alanine amidase